MDFGALTAPDRTDSLNPGKTVLATSKPFENRVARSTAVTLVQCVFATFSAVPRDRFPSF